MSKPATSTEAQHAFPHTRWSVVLAATQKNSPESGAALESLCRAYWYPLYSHVRRCGQSPHDAQDLTQEFFCRLLEKRWLDSANREKGKLRTFLISALKNFMSNEWRRASAQRRGGGHTFVPFDAEIAESRFVADHSAQLPAEESFDRQWALTLLELTLARLREEYKTTNKLSEFEILQGCLTGARGSVDYAALSARLGSSEGATRVAAHRLRKRFREIYREEIKQTLSDEADVDGELRHLAAALGRE